MSRITIKNQTNKVEVEVRVGSESFRVSPPFIIGRVEEENEELDRLAIKDSSGKLLYKFNGVRCRWGCDTSKGDYDCVSHEHVLVETEGDGIRVRHVGRTKTYLQSSQELSRDGVFMGFGSRLAMRIPGLTPPELVELSTVSTSSTPTPTPTVSPPPQHASEQDPDLLNALCDVYEPINAYLGVLGDVLTDKDLDGLRNTLAQLKGDVSGAKDALRTKHKYEQANIMDDLYNRLDNIVSMISVASPDRIDVPNLKGRLREIRSFITSLMRIDECNTDNQR
ncbi:hypothetical protein [Thermocladium modestius]|nr:hypothetical protein [Thermocladium modestius]